MGEKMTLKQVRGELMTQCEIEGDKPITKFYERIIGAIDAHLATPAQTVDVERTFAVFRIVENADVPNGEIWVYDKSKITTEVLATKVKP